ncbi:hypothetical protein [Amycolatopsis sp. NPDC049159]|uniref:hypothetical protein n=1 Tax=Amycolatopsis sp. NPDC049159 TaxID=3157210 RepID=UPI0033C7B644
MPETWQADVLGCLAGEVWAIEWPGEAVRERMTARLDVLVWLDHPRTLTVARVVSRTPKRRVGRGSKHIVGIAWRYHPITRARVRRVIEAAGFKGRFPRWWADVARVPVMFPP